METLRPLRNAKFTDIIDYGFFLYKKHFRKIFLLDLMFYLPFAVLYTIINPVFTDSYLNFFNTPEAGPAEIVFENYPTNYCTIVPPSSPAN
jgi:hypothetical protein